MVLETSACSSFNHLMQLLVQEYFIELTQKLSNRRLGWILLPPWAAQYVHVRQYYKYGSETELLFVSF
jgi:hypothetical protein